MADAPSPKSSPSPRTTSTAPAPKLSLVVVDPDPAVRQEAVSLLKIAFPNIPCTACENGGQAITCLSPGRTNLILADLLAKGEGRLSLVADLHAQCPANPVIVMTSRGTEAAIPKALRSGAVSYIPKHRLTEELEETVRWVLASADQRALHEEIFAYMDQLHRQYSLPNRTELIAPLITEMQLDLRRLGVCPEEDLVRFGVAMTETLMNAMIHGNLGLPGHLLSNGIHAFREQVEYRLAAAPWKDRRVHVEVRADRTQATCTVRDEGDGFDPATLPDPTEEDALLRPHGRGLLLIRSFMNEVRFNKTGNEITLVKRCPTSRAAATTCA